MCLEQDATSWMHVVWARRPDGDAMLPVNDSADRLRAPTQHLQLSLFEHDPGTCDGACGTVVVNHVNGSIESCIHLRLSVSR